MDCSLSLWMWIVCLMTVLVLVDADCPRDAQKKAMLCTAGLGIGPSPSGPPQFVELGQVERAKTACREGLFTKAISCLRKLREKCTGNTEEEHILRMMVDPERSETSVNYFCENLSTYERHAQCIVDANEERSNCTGEVKKNFKTKAMATVNMDVLMTSTCRFFKSAVSCSYDVIKRRCGESPADIVVTILNGFQPPKCLELTFDDDGTVTDKDSTASVVGQVSLMLSSLLVILTCVM